MRKGRKSNCWEPIHAEFAEAANDMGFDIFRNFMGFQRFIVILSDIYLCSWSLSFFTRKFTKKRDDEIQLT